MLKNPKHGYGSGMNPCIDCRMMMYDEAKKHMDEIGADFIITGEVLHQRPMSQNSNALSIIEKGTETEGKVLRPLSARLLPLTNPENNGLINRSIHRLRRSSCPNVGPPRRSSRCTKSKPICSRHWPCWLCASPSSWGATASSRASGTGGRDAQPLGAEAHGCTTGAHHKRTRWGGEQRGTTGKEPESERTEPSPFPQVRAGISPQ